jgi:hypothetical protein
LSTIGGNQLGFLRQTRLERYEKIAELASFLAKFFLLFAVFL